MTQPYDAMIRTLETQMRELEQKYARYVFLRLPLDLNITLGSTSTITTDTATYHGVVYDIHPTPEINCVYVKLERINDEHRTIEQSEDRSYRWRITDDEMWQGGYPTYQAALEAMQAELKKRSNADVS
jgi:hypothetical protein